jgi:uncharacterized membrane protein YozB (DUF420 family)
MTYATGRQRRQWIGITALALVAVAFLAYSIPPYLTGDPTQSRVPATFGLHYPLLVAHVALASVAMVTALPQLVPWVRRRYPVAHRRVGTVYVYAAVGAGVCGWVLGAATPFGPILRVSNVVLASLWLWFTITAYRAARRRDFVRHRRQMLCGVALTFSIISNRIWAVVFTIALDPLRTSVFHGDEDAFIEMVAGLSGWLGWTVPLLAVQWWLARTTKLPRSSNMQVKDSQPV